MWKNQPIGFKQFDTLYQDVVSNVYHHWTDDMQEQLAQHCYGWKNGLFDFRKYLTTSSIRYYYAYKELCKAGNSVCDVGGFWGVFP